MTMEHRLTRAFDHVEDLDPSDDLWSRVLHSIEEDQQHRQRVRGTALALVVCLGMMIAVVAFFARDGVRGTYVQPTVMLVVETLVLVGLVFVLGPAIRRFGRGYVADLWPGESPVPAALLRLLDLAYYMVFAGYILLTTRLDLLGDISPQLQLERRLPEQLEFAAQRVGGLLIVMGILHAVTLAVLPAIAFIDRATRAGARLPRWMLIVAILFAVQVVPLIPMLLAIGLSG